MRAPALVDGNAGIVIMAHAGKEIVYGLHAVRARLKRDPANCERLLVVAANSSRRIRELRTLATREELRVEEVDRDELDRVAEGNHQGVALVCSERRDQGDSFLAELLREGSPDRLLLLLDGVTDPHNLGACLRSAAALGVDAVVVPKDRAAGITPVVSKVASGGAELVPFVRVTNLARTIDALKEAGIWVIGLTADAEEAIGAVDLTGPVALVLGSEGAGLRRLTAAKCDRLAKIPLALGTFPQGRAESALDSLNVSVAAGIALYEVERQRARQAGRDG